MCSSKLGESKDEEKSLSGYLKNGDGVGRARIVLRDIERRYEFRERSNSV